MLDQVKRKVTLDLLLSPYSLVPAVIGATAMIATWANDGPAWLAFAGISGVIAGIGILVSRYMLSLDNLMQKAWENTRNEEKKKKDEQILALHDLLISDHDARVTTALRELVSAFAAFHKNINQKDINVPTKSTLVEKVNSLFDACLKQLERTHDLCQQQKQLSGNAKKTIRDQRDQIIADVQASIVSMGGTLDECIQIATNSEGNTSELRNELETSMKVARRTDERMSQLGIGREKI
jgi:hypothetical protein